MRRGGEGVMFNISVFKREKHLIFKKLRKVSRFVRM